MKSSMRVAAVHLVGDNKGIIKLESDKGANHRAKHIIVMKHHLYVCIVITNRRV